MHATPGGSPAGGCFYLQLDKGAALHYNTSKMNYPKMKGRMRMNPSMEYAIKTSLAYSAVCKPLCQELRLPQTAFDILMFLANNPDCKTARDIVEIRRIKANLVSVNVDLLVQEGYLQRQPVESDRRKTQLVCTAKAQPVIARGREVQEAFFDRLLDHTDEAMRQAFFATLEIVRQNLDDILKENA